MEVTQRPVTESDTAFVRQLIFEIVTAELGAEAWPEALRAPLLEMQYRARMQSRLTERPGASQQILLMDKVPAGWWVVARDNDTIQLVDIAVLHALRGRGVASACVRLLQEEARRDGKRVRLSVAVTSPAVALYTRLGFTRVDGDGVRDVMEWAG